MTTDLVTRLSEEQKQTYIELLLLKLIDLDGAGEGGKELPVDLPRELAPLQTYLQELRFRGLLEVKAKPRKFLAVLTGKPKTQVYKLTAEGLDYLARMIDEADSYIADYDDLEVPELVEAAQADKLDPVRIRFLWGWCQGEFDDLVLFQERRGIKPVEQLWAYYLTSDDFFTEVLSDLKA